ncbi:hypothetical protein V2G26_009142 [Clonostachys chloroleuca]
MHAPFLGRCVRCSIADVVVHRTGVPVFLGGTPRDSRPANPALRTKALCICQHRHAPGSSLGPLGAQLLYLTSIIAASNPQHHLSIDSASSLALASSSSPMGHAALIGRRLSSGEKAHASKPAKASQILKTTNRRYLCVGTSVLSYASPVDGTEYVH